MRNFNFCCMPWSGKAIPDCEDLSLAKLLIILKNLWNSVWMTFLLEVFVGSLTTAVSVKYMIVREKKRDTKSFPAGIKGQSISRMEARCEYSLSRWGRMFSVCTWSYSNFYIARCIAGSWSKTETCSLGCTESEVDKLAVGTKLYINT